MFGDERYVNGEALLLNGSNSDAPYFNAPSSSPSSSSSRVRSYYTKHRKAFLFTVVFVVTASIIGVAILFTRPSLDEADNDHTPNGGDTPPHAPGQPFSFLDALSPPLTVRYASLSWSPFDDSYVTRDASSQDFVQVTLKVVGTSYTNSTRLLVNHRDVPAGMDQYTYSSDYTWFLFRTRFQSLYRHSGTAQYVLYNTLTRTTREVGTISNQRLQFATLTPSLVEPAVVYVYQNNIYYQPLVQGKPWQGLTTDGVNNEVINGVCDWVYEEEVYSRTSAVWFNDDGSALAFLRFDEREVPEYSFPLYDAPNNNMYTYKYPKVAQNNSKVSLGVWRVGDKQPAMYSFGSETTDQYIINVVWFGPSVVTAKVMPRLQTDYTLWAVYLDHTTVPRALHRDHNDWYIDTDFTLRYLRDMNLYIDKFAHNNRHHLALYNEDGSFVKWLTSSSDWSVLSVQCYDPVNSILYFTADFPSSVERTLHAVNVKTGVISSVVPWTGQRYVMQSASFSGRCAFFIVNEQAELLNTRLFSSNGQTPDKAQQLSVMRDNEAVKASFASYALPRKVLTTFPSKVVPDEQLNAYFLIPPTLQGINNEDCSYKYPVLVNPYAGPGSQQVTAVFGEGGNGGTGFNTYLSSSFGYIVLVVDPVGTGFKGNTFQQNYTTLKLTVSEEIDILNVIDLLADFCFVDTTRVAFSGHSYGGSMATRVATSTLSKRVFLNTVISGAPVTSFLLYDSIYTERYMRRPGNENPTGYEQMSLLGNRAKNITVPHYFLLHGTADDNVHYQNSALLTQQFTYNRVQFHMFDFINRNHGFYGFDGYGVASSPANFFYYELMTKIYYDMIQRPPSSALLSSPTVHSSRLSTPPYFDEHFNLDKLSLMWSSLSPEDRRERFGMMAP